MRIDITECDHDSFAIEEEVAARHGAELRVHRARDADEIVAACAGADAIVVQYARITADVLDRLPGLRAIGRYGVGVDSLDVEAATARGVAVCPVPDYGTESVSDHAIALTLAALREIPRMDRAVRYGADAFPAIRPMHTIAGRTFGVVGVGRIGTATARKAAALGFEVVGHDIAAPPGETVFHGVPTLSLTDLLERCDVVSLHTPLDASTHHLVGATELARMRDGAVLVNTSRGGVVDTDALVDALARGALRGAALDVSENEPLDPWHPLTGFENVTLTPHLAWYSEESYAELKRRVMENVAAVCAGERPRDVLNPEALGPRDAWDQAGGSGAGDAGPSGTATTGKQR